jgi:hypothetical protein
MRSVTAIKRLGGPNFNEIPINAPQCPVHIKFIGFITKAKPLLEQVCVEVNDDQGLVELSNTNQAIDRFFEAAKSLRYWDRGGKVKAFL